MDDEIRPEVAAMFDADTERMRLDAEQRDKRSRRLARDVGMQIQAVMADLDVSVEELAERVNSDVDQLRRLLLGEEWTDFRLLVALGQAMQCEIEISLVDRSVANPDPQ